MNRFAYCDCFTLSTTTLALALFCSRGFRNGPIACSASGSPSVRPVARPSQNIPPVQPLVVSKCSMGLLPPYALDGGFLLQTGLSRRPRTLLRPGRSARRVRSIRLATRGTRRGPDPPGLEVLWAKNTCLPSHCLSVKLAGLVFSGAGLSMELSPLPHPANITENEPALRVPIWRLLFIVFPASKIQA